MRKRRSDAILHNLPEATRRAIVSLDLDQGLSVKEIQVRLAAPLEEDGLGVGPVSAGAISNFLAEARSAFLRERMRQGVSTAHEVVDEGLAEHGEVMDEAIMAGIREWILDGLCSGKMDAKDARNLVGLILKDRQMQIDVRKVAILEKKAGIAEEVAGIVSDEALSDEEIRERTLKAVDSILLPGKGGAR
mgnify:CR=1 FL=1